MQLQDLTLHGKCGATSLLPATIRVHVTSPDMTHLDKSPSQSKIPYCPFAPSDSVTAWATPHMVFKSMQFYKCGDLKDLKAARIDNCRAELKAPTPLCGDSPLCLSQQLRLISDAHQEKLSQGGSGPGTVGY